MFLYVIIIIFGFTLYFLYQYSNNYLKSPKNLTYVIRETRMKKAKVELFWQPSESVDVVSQSLDIKVNGLDFYTDNELSPTVDLYELLLSENDTVDVVLKAFDGTFYSESALLNFTVPDLTSPVAPTNLNWRIVEILDVE